MSIVVETFRTLKCNGPDCPNTVTFNVKDEAKVSEETPWFRTTRIVQNAQGKNFLYCCDTCEVSNTATGAHNPEERKRVTLSEDVTMQEAARQAAVQEEATQAIKAGKPVTLQGR